LKRVSTNKFKQTNVRVVTVLKNLAAISIAMMMKMSPTQTERDGPADGIAIAMMTEKRIAIASKIEIVSGTGSPTTTRIEIEGETTILPIIALKKTAFARLSKMADLAGTAVAGKIETRSTVYDKMLSIA
jgi:hypothetical protein